MMTHNTIKPLHAWVTFSLAKKRTLHHEAAYKSQHTITAFNLSKYHQINRHWPVLIDQWSSPFNLQLIFFIRHRHSQSGIIWGRVITFCGRHAQEVASVQSIWQTIYINLYCCRFIRNLGKQRLRQGKKWHSRLPCKTHEMSKNCIYFVVALALFVKRLDN